jgi:2-keto-4-pentenoate hydratase
MHPPLILDAPDDDVADAMVADLLARRPLRDLTPFAGDSALRAYELQDAYRDALVAHAVRKGMCGYKLGRNSEKFALPDGTRATISAPLFSDRCFASGASLAVADFMVPQLEFEICAEISDTVPLSDQPYDRFSIAPYVARLFPAFEIIDFRGVEPAETALVNVIAHGVFGAALVIGGAGLPPDHVDIDTLPCVLSVDGAQVAAAVGSAPEHPLDGLAWLANHLAARQRRLEPGMLVMCGNHLPVLPAKAGQALTLDMGPIGRVEMRWR